MRTLFLCLVILGSIGSVAAQEERAIDNFSGVGVRAMGMGGAFVGVADDFTAVYWNPAGLAQIRNREVHLAFLRNSHANDATLSGVRTSSELNNTRFGSLGVVFPYPVYRGSLVFAAGFNRVKDFDWTLRERGFEEIEEGKDLEINHSFRHEGELSLTALAGAVDVSPAMSLGLTMGFVNGEDKSFSEFNWTDPQDHFIQSRFLSRETSEDEFKSSFYASLGAMLRTSREKPKFRLGATVTTGATHKISYVFTGASSETGYDLIEFDDEPSQEFSPEVFRDSYKISLPLEFAIGASYMPVDGLLLAGSLHYAEWSQSEYEEIDDSQFRANTSFDIQYRDVTQYHLGLEWQVPIISLDLRAGFYTDPVPFVGPRNPDPVLDIPPIDIEEDRHFWTLGAGLLVDEVIQVDVGWLRGNFKQVEIRSDEKKTTEKNTINRLLAAVSYRF